MKSMYDKNAKYAVLVTFILCIDKATDETRKLNASFVRSLKRNELMEVMRYGRDIFDATSDYELFCFIEEAIAGRYS